MYRSAGTRLPVQYYNRLPKEQASDVAYIVDICIATAETIRAVCSIVERWGAKKIIVLAVIAAKEGIGEASSICILPLTFLSPTYTFSPLTYKYTTSTPLHPSPPPSLPYLLSHR